MWGREKGERGHGMLLEGGLPSFAPVPVCFSPPSGGIIKRGPSLTSLQRGQSDYSTPSPVKLKLKWDYWDHTLGSKVDNESGTHAIVRLYMRTVDECDIHRKCLPAWGCKLALVWKGFQIFALGALSQNWKLSKISEKVGEREADALKRILVDCLNIMASITFSKLGLIKIVLIWNSDLSK